MPRPAKRRAASHTTRLRERLFARQGGRCHYCDEQMTMRNYHDLGVRPTDATIEHLVPRALGGGNALPNLVAACSRCNALGGRIDKWCVDTFGGRRQSRAEQHRARRSA
jgi:5-methylcytosine-specific restriction endonuclease McrA